MGITLGNCKFVKDKFYFAVTFFCVSHEVKSAIYFMA